VRLLARVLGVSMSNLYQAATVVSTFPSGRFEELGARRTTFGLPLSFSHLEVLTRVKTESLREALLERAYAEGLSVRELDEEVRSAPRTLPMVDPSKAVRKAVSVARLLRLRRDELLEALSTLHRAGEDEQLLSEFAEAHAAMATFVEQAKRFLPAKDGGDSRVQSRVTSGAATSLWGVPGGDS
jgi:hypothetical protein